ncbi:MAG: hypothetical protein ACP5UZ_08170 [Thermoplasmata archaeon]
MIQPSLLTFAKIIPQKKHKLRSVLEKEELTVKLSSESPTSNGKGDSSIRELGKLKKLRDQYLETAKTSTNPREIIFAVKFVESLGPQIERLEREVSE